MERRTMQCVDPPAQGSGRGLILVLGGEGGATTELCEQLEPTRCTVVRRRLGSSLEGLTPAPNLVAIVAPDRAAVSAVASGVARVFPAARVVGFTATSDGPDGAGADLRHVARVFELDTLSTRPLAAVTHLVLDNEALVGRLHSVTDDLARLVAARAAARRCLHESAQGIRSNAAGVLLALDALRWSLADVPATEAAIFESIRASVEALVDIAEGLPALDVPEADPGEGSRGRRISGVISTTLSLDRTDG
jgi:hypothetical protein